MVYDGLVSKFPDEVPVTLARSGWAGSQRFGASNWNGDLTATWENFQKTIVSGLNAQLSGLAWWTHDIGAIGGCNNKDPGYRCGKRACCEPYICSERSIYQDRLGTKDRKS